MIKKEKFGWEIIPVEDTEIVDFDLSLIYMADLCVDIEAIDKDGNVIELITTKPICDRVNFNHKEEYYKYRICPVKTKNTLWP